MKTVYLTDTEAYTYWTLSKLAARINDAISEFDVAILSSNIPEGVKRRCLDITYNLNTFGLAYRLTPQSEWMGGESFKTRAPHIAMQED